MGKAIAAEVVLCVSVYMCTYSFYAHLHNCESQLLALSCLSVHPSTHVEQLGAH